MTNQPVRPATRDELRDILDHALRYGRSGHPRRYTSDAMARIAADALVDHLERSGCVALQTPPVPLRCVTTLLQKGRCDGPQADSPGSR